VNSTEVTSDGALDDRRLWKRVVRTVLRRVETGELQPGARVPGTRALAAELGMSTGPVILAYRYLAREQVIHGGRASRTAQAGYVVAASFSHPAADDWDSSRVFLGDLLTAGRDEQPGAFLKLPAAPRSRPGYLPAPAEPDRIARGLRRIRLERGWHQHEVAALLGVSISVVSRLETGERRVRSDCAEFAAQLGVEVGELLRDCPRCGYAPPGGYQCGRCGTSGKPDG
jgi:hypothetical protein